MTIISRNIKFRMGECGGLFYYDVWNASWDKIENINLDFASLYPEAYSMYLNYHNKSKISKMIELF